MLDDLDRQILDAPECDAALTALPYLIALQEQGKSTLEIAAGLFAATGMRLVPASVERILGGARRPVQVASPVAAGAGPSAPMWPAHELAAAG